MSPYRSWLGVGFVLLLSACFALGSVLARLAFEEGASIFTLNFLRTAGATLTVTLFLKLQGRRAQLPPATARAAAFLGVLIAAYAYALFVAIQRMPVALAIVTFYTWPLMVGIGSWLSGAERLAWQWPVAALAALVGLFLALDAIGTMPDPAGVGFALAAALGWTVVLIANRHLVRGGDSQPVTFHMMLAACAVNLAGCLLTGFVPPQTTIGWVGLLGSVGLYCFASVGTFIAVSINGPVRTALIMNFEPIASLIAAVVLLDQVLSPLQVFGAVLVVCSLIMARRASTPVA